MTRAAHITDIIARSFFIFVVLWLVFSYVFRSTPAVLFVSILITAAINVVFELTAGKKYWKNSVPAKPRRCVKQIAKELFVRAFSRQRTKGFVWAGIVLLSMSFIVSLNIYYIVFACAVFIFAAITRFAPPAKCATINSGNGNGEQSPPNEDAGETVCADLTQSPQGGGAV